MRDTFARLVAKVVDGQLCVGRGSRTVAAHRGTVVASVMVALHTGRRAHSVGQYPRKSLVP